MITFSVNGDRLNEDLLKNIAQLLKVLKDNPNSDEHTRYAVNKLIELKYFGRKKSFPPSYNPNEDMDYSSYGRKMEERDRLNASRRQENGEKIYAKSTEDISLFTPNSDFAVDAKVELNLELLVLLGVFDIVERYLSKQKFSLFKYIESILEFKVKIEDGFIVKDKEQVDKIIKLMSEYGDCFDFLIPTADGSTHTDDIILYMEQHDFKYFFEDVVKNSRYFWKILKQRYGKNK